MSKDFTLSIYQKLLESAIEAGYELTSFEDFIQNHDGKKKTFILRHDVDKLPLNSVDTARVQADLGVKGTYFFRVVKESYDPKAIEAIRELGHEIGYHYEDMALCHGDYQMAIAHFEKWLNKFREFYPVKTICMHGSPMSRWDNRDLWKKYDYRKYNIIAEPYYDVDFDKVFYITDTGRRWDGGRESIRDKVDSGFDLSFSSTQQLIDAFRQDQMPKVIMHTIHPQRWTNNSIIWMKEFVAQNLKNQVKAVLLRRRKA